MKKVIIILVVILTVACFAETSGKKEEGYGGFGFGTGTMNLDKMNNKLTSLGFEKLDNSFKTFGGGGYALKDDFLIGGSGFGILPQTVENDSVKATFSGGGGFFDMGYCVYKNRNFKLFSIFGIGGTGTDLQLVKKKRSTLTFDEILKDPEVTSNVIGGGLAIKLEVMSQFIFNVSKEDNETFNIAAALSAGMTYQLTNDEWQVEDLDLSGVPELEPQRYYVTLSIYFGGEKTE